jgi:hypothetical protein
LNESGICTLELYTKIFAEPARVDRVAIKLRKVNSVLLDWRENEKRRRRNGGL